MYSEQFQESLKAVEAARAANVAYEPARMTAQEKDDLLAEVGHPFLMAKADAGLWKPGIRKCDHVLDVWRAIIRHGGELPDVIE